MTKLNLTRVFDSGRVIQTFAKAGIGDLEDFITYLYDFSNQMIGAIRKTLTIEDNLDSDVKILDLKNGVSQEISLSNPKKIPNHCWISKVTPFENSPLSFNWQMTKDGTLEVKATFTDSPTTPVTVKLVILF